MTVTYDGGKLDSLKEQLGGGQREFGDCGQKDLRMTRFLDQLHLDDI